MGKLYVGSDETSEAYRHADTLSLPPFSFKPIAQNAPGRFWEVGVPVGKQIIAARLSWNDDRVTLMYVVPDGARRKQQPAFRYIARILEKGGLPGANSIQNQHRNWPGIVPCVL